MRMRVKNINLDAQIRRIGKFLTFDHYFFSHNNALTTHDLNVKLTLSRQHVTLYNSLKLSHDKNSLFQRQNSHNTTWFYIFDANLDFFHFFYSLSTFNFFNYTKSRDDQVDVHLISLTMLCEWFVRVHKLNIASK